MALVAPDQEWSVGGALREGVTMIEAQQLMDLWIVPTDEQADPVVAFGVVYADPVRINGTPMSVSDLVARARTLHLAFADHVIELVDQVKQQDKLAIAFRHAARHVGPWTTPLGVIEPTGRTVTGLGIDLLTFDSDGRISEIWVLADELRRVLQVR
jgi:hypothetical protein